MTPLTEVAPAENISLSWRAFLRDVRKWAIIARERAALRQTETAKSELASEHKK
jgi:hypothetical protein